jgi:succinate dehydrogenase/fumarate reductase flavoprotein subunit
LVGVRPITNREYTADGELLPNNVTKKQYQDLDLAGRTPLYRGLDHLSELFAKRHEVNFTDEGFLNLELAGKRGFSPRNHWLSVSRDKPYVVCGTALDMPGLATDENFRTTLPGLYAAGDVISGCGAVMSGVLSGFFAAEVIGDYVNSAGEAVLDEGQADSQIESARAPLFVKNGQEPIEFESAVRMITEKYCGVFKSEGKLREGLWRLESLRREFIPKLMAENPHYLMRCLENRNIAQISEIYMKACMARRETRGLFNRADYPQKDPARDGKLTYQRFENDEVVVELKEAPRLNLELFNGGGTKNVG